MTINAIKCGICVVNYNSLELLRVLLGSVQGDITWAIVDNSGELESGPSGILADREGKILKPAANLGFGAAQNLGMEWLISQECSRLIALNPDTELIEGSVQAWCAAYETGTVSTPKILFRDASDRLRVWSWGGQIDATFGLTVKHHQFGILANELQAPPEDISFATGAAFLVDAASWEKSGGFATDYFLYWEDVDLSIRLLQAGIPIIASEEVSFLHYEGATSESSLTSRSPAYMYYNARNAILCARRHCNSVGQFGAALRSLVRLARTPMLPCKHWAWAWRGFLEGLLGRRGRRSGLGASTSFLEALPGRGLSATWLNHVSAQQVHQEDLADILFIGVDGTFLQVMLRLRGIRVSRSSADISLPAVVERVSKSGGRIALIGSYPGVASRAAQELGLSFGKVECYDGYESLQLILSGNLRLNHPELVIISAGAGVQERAVSALSKIYPDASVVSSGGWFDQLAVGGLSYFPEWAHRFRIGWFIRVCREPQRLLRRYTWDALLAIRRYRDLTSVFRHGGRVLVDDGAVLNRARVS